MRQRFLTPSQRRRVRTAIAAIEAWRAGWMASDTLIELCRPVLPDPEQATLDPVTARYLLAHLRTKLEWADHREEVAG